MGNGALIDEFVGRVSVCKEGSGRPSCLSNVSPPRRAALIGSPEVSLSDLFD